MARFPAGVRLPHPPAEIAGVWPTGEPRRGSFPRVTGQQKWIDYRSGQNMEAVIGRYSSCAELISASDPPIAIISDCSAFLAF